MWHEEVYKKLFDEIVALKLVTKDNHEKVGEEVYKILNKQGLRSKQAAAKMMYLMRRLLNERLGNRLDLARFGSERPINRKWRIRFIAHHAAVYHQAR